MALIPPPGRYRGPLEPLDPRCGRSGCLDCAGWAARLARPDAPALDEADWPGIARRLGLLDADLGGGFAEAAGTWNACGTRETWRLVPCAEVKLASAVPVPDVGTPPGTNVQNYKAVAAIGRHPNLGPWAGCNFAPLFSRVSLSFAFVHTDPATVAALGMVTPPPPIHFELRGGDHAIVARLARGVWSPADWEDGQMVCQVDAWLISQMQLWCYAEQPVISDVRARWPYKVKPTFQVDRHGDGAPGATFIADANCAQDATPP